MVPTGAEGTKNSLEDQEGAVSTVEIQELHVVVALSRHGQMRKTGKETKKEGIGKESDDVVCGGVVQLVIALGSSEEDRGTKDS